jgi:hypothetical protein
MSNNEKQTKPLSCFYCDNASIKPGRHATAFARFQPPCALCHCLTVSPDIFALYEKRHGRLAMHAAGWMPYHCGHFSARMIRVKCAYRPCTKTIDAPEWEAAKRMYIGTHDELCCSAFCAEVLHKELLLEMERKNGQKGNS